MVEEFSIQGYRNSKLVKDICFPSLDLCFFQRCNSTQRRLVLGSIRRLHETHLFTQNRHASWQHSHEQGNHTISQPVLAIYPTDDPVADWVKVAEHLKSNSFLPSISIEVRFPYMRQPWRLEMLLQIVEGTHWIQLENPHKVNDAMRKWLDENFGSKHVTDEL